MAKMRCPKCDSEVPAEDGWAKAALSSMIPAPAVPDMATQVRCPGCHAVFAQSDVIYTGAPAASHSGTLAWLAFFAVVAWASYQFAVM